MSAGNPPQTAPEPLCIDVSTAERQLLLAVGAYPSGQGWLPVIRHVVECLAQTDQPQPAPELVGWLQVARTLETRLALAVENHTQLSISGDPSRLDPTFALFTKRLPATLPTPTHHVILGELGRCIALCASKATRLPRALADSFATLLRSGQHHAKRRPDWAILGGEFLSAIEDLQAWRGRTRENQILNFIGELEAVRKSALKPPAAFDLRVPSKESQPSNASAEPFLAQSPPSASSKGSGDDDAGAEDGGGADASDPPGKVHNLLGWRSKRAVQASLREHFGVNGQWNTQTPAETKAIAAEIGREIRGRGPNCDEALFAVVCLLSSLPADKALQISLQPSTDLHLWEFRQLRWSLSHFLNTQPTEGQDFATTLPEEIVTIPLPEFVVEAGRDLMARCPEARTVGQLFAGSDDEKMLPTFLGKYRDWLRSTGCDMRHKVYDARFASSLSQMYRANSGDVVTALMTLSFEEAATGAFHYVRLPRSFLHNEVARVYAELGWGKPDSVQISAYVGMSRALGLKQFAECIEQLDQHCKALRRDLEAARSPEELVSKQRLLVHHRVLGVLSLAGHRGKHLARLTWRTFYGHRDYILIADKDIDPYSDFRAVPVWHPLACWLEAHIADLQLFRERAQAMDLRFAKGHESRLFERKGKRPCFVVASLGESFGPGIVGTEQLDRQVLTALAQATFERDLNAGRHALISAMVCHGVDSWLIKSFSGHHRGQAEPFADVGAVSPQYALHELRNSLNQLFASVAAADAPQSGDRFVLPFSEMCRTLPSPLASPARRPDQSRDRVLIEPFDRCSLSALRVVEVMRERLLQGSGPTPLAAQLLMSLVLFDGICLADAATLWSQTAPFHAAPKGAPMAVWVRPGSLNEIHVPLCPATVLILLNLKRSGALPLPQFEHAKEMAGRWVANLACDAPWPSDGRVVMDVVGALMARYQRVTIPPFLLAASDVSLQSPTANRMSICRLMEPADDRTALDEELILPSPEARGFHRVQRPLSELEAVKARIHHCGDQRAHLGEEFRRWSRLMREVEAIVTGDDQRAQAVVAWLRVHSKPWAAGTTGSLQVSSVSTYLRLFERALGDIDASEPLPLWSEEWLEFVASLRADADSDRHRKELNVALNSFFNALSASSYAVPPQLISRLEVDQKELIKPRAAASTLIFAHDRRRIERLFERRYRQHPLLSLLAKLYPRLRWEASLRSGEAAVLDLEALNVDGLLVVTSAGFSHLKSGNARRLQEVSAELVTAFAEAKHLIRGANSKAKWLFLDDAGHRSRIDEL